MYVISLYRAIILVIFLPQDCLSPLSMQALPAASESLCIVEMGGTDTSGESGEAASGGLYLNIGKHQCITPGHPAFVLE